MSMKRSVMPAFNLAVGLMLLLVTLGGTVAGAQSVPRPHATPEASREASPPSIPVKAGSERDTATNWTVANSREIKVKGQPVAISPDAKWLAGPGPDKNFCVWDVATLQATCDGRDLAIQSETIRWSPDSTAVAFSLEAAKYLIDSDIYVFDVGSGRLKDLTEDGLSGGIKFGTTPSAGPVNLDIYPAWSPNGTSLLFARTNWNSETRGTTLMTIAREGSDAQPLFALAPPEPLIINSTMYWLADDSILFSVAHGDLHNGQNGLWLRTASGQLTQLLKGDATSEVPMPGVTSVSPDGSTATVVSIVKRVQSGTHVPSGVFFTLDLQNRQLTDMPKPGDDPTAFVTLPARFSDDGNAIVYAVYDGGEQRLAIVSVGGETPTYLPLEQPIAAVGSTQGLQLAAGNTLYIPTNGTISGTGLILTLTPPVEQGTPIPPCGCTPPPAG